MVISLLIFNMNILSIGWKESLQLGIGMYDYMPIDVYVPVFIHILTYINMHFGAYTHTCIASVFLGRNT